MPLYTTGDQSVFKPIHVSVFHSHVLEMHSNSDQEFDNEFKVYNTHFSFICFVHSLVNTCYLSNAVYSYVFWSSLHYW